jgi:hypothetical protein
MEQEKEEFNKIIGLRIKSARLIYNEGIRLTVDQFAHLLDISGDKLNNYEMGRSALPIDVLLEYYNRGISPTFIIAGKGDIFVNNDVGNAVRQSILAKNIWYPDIVSQLTGIPTQEISRKIKRIANNDVNSSIIKVAAGRLQK